MWSLTGSAVLSTRQFAVTGRHMPEYSWAEPDLNARERSGNKPIPSFVPPSTGYYAILAAYRVICGCDMYAGQTRSHTVDHK